MQTNPTYNTHEEVQQLLTAKGIPTEAIVFAGDYVNVKRLITDTDFKQINPKRTKNTFTIYREDLGSYVSTMQYGFHEFSETKANDLVKFYLTLYPILEDAN